MICRSGKEMITKGTMRRVFLTKNYAIKIPRLRNLLRGWIANKSEVHYYKESNVILL